MFNRCFQPESVFSTRGVSSKISQDNFTLRPDPESQVQEFEAGGCQAGSSHHSRTHPVGKTQSGYQCRCFSAPENSGYVWQLQGRKILVTVHESCVCSREGKHPIYILNTRIKWCKSYRQIKIYIQNLTFRTYNIFFIFRVFVCKLKTDVTKTTNDGLSKNIWICSVSFERLENVMLTGKFKTSSCLFASQRRKVFVVKQKNIKHYLKNTQDMVRL